MLNERVKADQLPDWDFEAQREARRQLQADFEAHAEDEAEGAIKPQKAIYDVRQALGPHDILLSGVGAHKMWVARHFHCHEPNTCIIPNGFCSMGLPLPGSIAAHLVVLDSLDGGPPGRKVFAIVGDGDFLMNVQEMETARRLNANINIMVWEDGGYGLISWKQENDFGRHTNMSFDNPDWLKLAEAFGWQGQVVDKSAELRPAIDTALAYDGPSLIVVPIDYRENPKLTERLGSIICQI
jgi:acetolactate synthase-1/2/3 large subunit